MKGVFHFFLLTFLALPKVGQAQGFIDYYNLCNLGEYLIHKGRSADAIKVYKKAFTFVDTPKAIECVSLAKAYCQTGDLLKSFSILEENYQKEILAFPFQLKYEDSLFGPMMKDELYGPKIDTLMNKWEYHLENRVSIYKNFTPLLKFILDQDKRFTANRGLTSHRLGDSLFYQHLLEYFEENGFLGTYKAGSENLLLVLLHAYGGEQHNRYKKMLRKELIAGNIRPVMFFLMVDRKDYGVDRKCGLYTTYTERYCNLEQDGLEIALRRMEYGATIFFKIPKANYRNRKVEMENLESLEPYLDILYKQYKLGIKL